MTRLALVALVVTGLFSCQFPPTQEPASKVEQPLFANGDFETDDIGDAPASWVIERYLNDRVTPLAGTSTDNQGLLAVPPSTIAELNLTPDAGGLNVRVVGGATLSVADPNLGNGASLRYPRFGNRSVLVNGGSQNQGPSNAQPTGRNRSGASMKQTMTVSNADVDSADGLVHLRFVAAPVLENPGHEPYEQPYFFIQLRNLTRDTTLYTNFNFAGQPGVPWQTTGGIQYTDWQLIDVAPGDGVSLGDQVELIVFAVGCGRRGHWGRVYIDSFGATIPGLYVTGTAPAVSANGTTLTYTLTYRNNSGAQTTNTSLVFNTPPGTTFASHTGASCTAPTVGTAGAVTCSLGTLAAGTTGSYTVTVNVPLSVTGLLTAQNYSIEATNASRLLGSKIDTFIYTGALTLSAISGTPQSTTVNTAFGASLVVEARDTLNVRVPFVRVNFTPPSSGASATFTQSFGLTGSDGRVSLLPTANTVAGTYSVSAAASGAPLPVSFNLTNAPGAPATISVVSGNNQSATVTQGYGAPLVVQVVDAFGNPISGATVAFSAPGTGASASLSSPSTTNAQGRTQVTATANTVTGGYSVTATVNGRTTTFTLTNTPGPAATVTVVSGSPQSTQVTTGFANPLIVLVRDAQSNPVPGVAVAFTAPSSGASAVLTSPAVTNAQGRTQVTATANATAGTYTVSAAASGVAATASFSLTNTAGPVASIAAVSGTPQSTVVTTAFSAPLVVELRDAQNNPVSGAAVTFTVPATGASASLTTPATTNAQGRTQVTATANGTAGTYTVSAANGVRSAAFTLTNTPGPVASLSVVSGSGQSTQVTTAFGSPLVVVARDAQGNVVPNVTVTFTRPNSGASATLSTPAVTNASGQTQVTATANSVSGTYSVTASVGGVSVSFTLTNTAGPVASMSVVGGTPQSRTVTLAFTNPLVVELRDAQNNPVSGATVTFTAPATGATATLTSPAVTNAQGRTQVTATANSVAGTYTVSAANGSRSVTFDLTNTPGPAASISVVSGSGQSAPISSAFGNPLVVVVRDAQSNPIPGATVTFASPGSGASATLSTPAVTSASGQTQVTATANTTSGTYTVSASVAGVATAASFTLTNSAGVPASITVVSGTPQSAQVTTAFAAPLVVEVRDAQNNPVSGVAVTFTGPTTGARATFSTPATTNAQGRTQVTATAGTVSGGPYTVSARVTGVSTAATFSLTNTVGPAASVAVVSGTPQSAAITMRFATNLTVVVRDAQSNVIPGVTVVFTAPGTGASATLTAPAVTNAQGRTAVTATANGTPGTYQVVASVSGVSGTAAFDLTNSSGVPASITAISGGGQTTQVTTAFTNPLVAEVRDGANNVVSGVVVTFTAPSTGASAVVTTTGTTNAQGRVSVNATANGVAGTYTVSGAVSGVTGTADFSLSNTPGAPAAVVVIGGSGQTTAPNSAFGQPLVLEVRDAQGNPLPNVTVTLAAPSSGASATVATTATTDASGRVSVTATANGTLGTYTVSASVSGVTTPASFTLTNGAGAATTLSLESGDAQRAVVTAAYAQPLVIRVTDVAGLGVPNATVDLAVPSTGASVTLSSNTVVTDAQGRASVTATANTRAGSVSVRITSGTLAAVTAMLTNEPGAPASVRVVSGGTQTATTTTQFPAPLVVEVVDAFGNPVPNATVDWSAPSTGASGTPSASSSTTDAQGRAQITVTANATAGSYPVTARLPGGQQVDFVLTNTDATAVVVAVVSGTPQSTTVGTAFPAPLVVSVQRAGQPVANTTVTFSVPSAGPSASLSMSSVSTDAQGRAQVQATATTVAGAFEVRASAAGSASPAVFSLTNLAGAPVALEPVPGSTPQTAQTGDAFAPLSVRVVDQYGNPVPGAMVTFAAPATGATAVLGTPSTVTTDASGVATVTATAGTTPGTYSVTVSASGVPDVQLELTNSTTAPLVVEVTGGSPQQTTVGTAFGSALALKVTRGGVPQPNVTVTYLVPASEPTSTLSALSVVTDASGLGQVTATAGQKAGRFVVSATVPNGAQPARFELTSVAGAPASVTALASSTPQSTVVKTAFSLPLTVSVADAFGNPVSGVVVTYAAPGSEPTATLTQQVPSTDSAGQTSVTAIASAQAGSYEVTASVTGVTAPARFALTNVDPGTGAFTVAVVSGAEQSTIATTAFPMPLVAQVTDGSGAAVANQPVTLSLPSTGPSASATPTSLLTDAQGRVSVQLVANDVLGAFTASLTVAGAPTPSTARFSITAIPTTTTITPAPAQPRVGTPATLEATVSATQRMPSGQVRFLVDGVEVGSAPLESGRASLANVSLSGGPHNVEAVFDAQGPFGASRSGAVDLEVLADDGSLNGGGGCSCGSTPLGGELSWLALIGLLLSSARRARATSFKLVARSGGVVTAVLLSMPVLLAMPGWAQVAPSGVSLNTFHASAAGSDWFGNDSLDFRGKVRPAVRLLFDYGHNPLVVYNADGSVRSIAVANQAWLNLGGSVALFDRFRVALNVPFAVHSGSFAAASYNGQSLQPTSTFGFGDLGVMADVRLVGTYESPFTLALGAELGIPSGNSQSYFGEGRVTVTPRLAAAGNVGFFAYAAQAAFAFRGGQLAGLTYGNEFRFAGSAGVRLFDKKLLIGPELHGLVDVSSLTAGRPVALEVDLGAHWRFHPDWRLSGGVGWGLSRSPGVPDYRLLGAVTWQPAIQEPPKVVDSDGDGVLDPDDECPSTPAGEHPDASRRGCPVLDTDGDGVLDDADLCVTVPKGATPNPAKLGCPDGDRDQDGVLDSQDVCADVPMGARPHPGRRGCPDPDTDKDGVSDSQDLCVDVPQGLKPDPARRGCPAPDRDQDFVADADDACPDTPGAPSPDVKKNGCPGLVKVEGSKILILQSVNFATNKDVILPSSNQVLTSVAETLKAFPVIQRLSIEGHTDSQGKAEANKDLSERRAKSVMRWLIEHGIEADRLEAHGYGLEQPIADNKTPAGRAKNRRVEFRIVKREGEE